MHVTKCDLCKKIIKNEPIKAGLGVIPKTELCWTCAAPIIKFLKQYQLLDKTDLADLQLKS